MADHHHHDHEHEHDHAYQRSLYKGFRLALCVPTKRSVGMVISALHGRIEVRWRIRPDSSAAGFLRCMQQATDL